MLRALTCSYPTENCRGLRPCPGVDAMTRPRPFSVGYEQVRARGILGPELSFLSFSPDVSRAHDEVVLPHNHLARAETRRRIVAIQGPIFDSTIDQYADDLQIPSSFFTVIVWRSNAGPKAVGLIVNQLALLDEERVNLGPPKKAKSANVKQWRVAISQIEKRTGLTFPQ